ncbi:siroheme synthase CysG [Mongoliimonas terrestris]|uniref:siroheme synthase CysG n=1 Tax=Mongoliimonas terrestris TaxID=1709001 RepID=UPI0009FA0202|nr:siroheme synthase CysG [Mongoliimonas terrestris]
MTRPIRSPREAMPARMGRLAKLPVFMDLRGRRVIVAGGGAGAAWKAELLAAAGAAVEIYADDPSDEMLQLLARGADDGSLTLHRRPWALDAFTPRPAFGLLVAEGEAEAQAFRCAARAAGVTVNIVDKPAYCDVQFGTIVNRSPVVVGISTDGAAPILGQTIRRRIETLLPPGLADWGALARRIRETVNARLKPGAERRRFWEMLAEKAFGPPPTVTDEADLLANADAIARADGPRGRVILVGAGPGDADLLTLKAVRALQSADVILFDDLVSADVLELARREAKRMMVGKRGGRESCRQEDINDLMITLARQGKRVVRLKAGDPMVFGRAGEEIARLEREGIPVEVVPGITAGIALASALGVSLTHRDTAHSLRFVTGHARTGHFDDGLDWRGLADPETTLVVYMGGRTAPQIATRLIAEGLSPETPVVLGYSVGQPGQRLVRRHLVDLAAPEAVEPGPAIVIGIGRVFAAVRCAECASDDRSRASDAPNTTASACSNQDFGFERLSACKRIPLSGRRSCG